MFTVGIIAKYWNEEILLPAWLSWLNMLDVDHIYLADDGSTDTSPTIALNYKHPKAEVHHTTTESPHDKYFVETIPESEKINKMLQEAYRQGCQWVIHLDIDEFPTMPMLHYINRELPHLVPNYGVYFPIFDMVDNLNTFLYENEVTKFKHYPCHHLKVFGRSSGYRRIVDGLNLDQGVTGGKCYIMTSFPYLHLKYLFKHRRWIRKTKLGGDEFCNIGKYTKGGFTDEMVPPPIKKWYSEFKEFDYIW